MSYVHWKYINSVNKFGSTHTCLHTCLLSQTNIVFLNKILLKQRKDDLFQCQRRNGTVYPESSILCYVDKLYSFLLFFVIFIILWIKPHLIDDMAPLNQREAESSTDLSRLQDPQIKYIPKITHHLTISTLH